jgi:hypothetical protein
MLMLSAAALFLVANANAEEVTSQPAMAHAHYGSDGFWHCDDGYLPAENTGVCTPEVLVRDRVSVYMRLRQFSEAARPGTVSQ